MKKIFNKVALFLLVVSSFCLPLKTSLALTDDEYQDVNGPLYYPEESDTLVNLKGVYFVDLSYEDNPQFGLRAIVANDNDYNISVPVHFSFYDENYYEVASSMITRPIEADNFESLNLLLSTDDLNEGYTVDDIAYYRVWLGPISEFFGEIEDNYDDFYNDTTVSNAEYVIENYDVNIVVNENNTFDITETITAYFNVPKHGIYRKIPLKNTVTRLDDTITKNRAQVTNVSVDNEYTTSKYDGIYEIKIGSASRTITGRHTYVIKYTYNIGKDPIEDADELYFNLIGTDWDTSINKVTFTIKMPKDFDYDKLGFSAGKYGSTENVKVDFKVKDNVITGEYDDILKDHEALTIRCELEEGYFVGAGLTYSIFDYLMFIIPVACALISLYIWFKYGRDAKVIETVEFHPPKGYNSLDVGFLYKGRVSNQDITSLLIYLANKGYLKITETEKKSFLSKDKDFKITKIKDYDGTDENEKLFMEGLFKNKKSKDKEEVITEVTSSDLYDSFYKTMNRIKSNVNTYDNKNKIFDKKASSKKKYLVIMMILTYLLITIPPLSAFGDLEMLVPAIIFPCMGFVFMFSILFSGTLNDNKGGGAIIVKIFVIIWGSLFGLVPWGAIVAPTLSQDLLYLSAYIVGAISIVLMLISFKFLTKRTKFGIEILGKLRGFKNFLKTAEKEKLEALVAEEPTYFYDILPFTYVLGVSDKWISKFESISLQAPTWYDGPDAFDIMYFNSFMNSTMESAQAAMSSSPSSSGSGSSGSSGGGFSGGGSGGGGGGSW